MRNFGNVPRKFPGIDFEEFFSVNSQEFPPNLVRTQPDPKGQGGGRGKRPWFGIKSAGGGNITILEAVNRPVKEMKKKTLKQTNIEIKLSHDQPLAVVLVKIQTMQTRCNNIIN